MVEEWLRGGGARYIQIALASDPARQFRRRLSFAASWMAAFGVEVWIFCWWRGTNDDVVAGQEYPESSSEGGKDRGSVRFPYHSPPNSSTGL